MNIQFFGSCRIYDPLTLLYKSSDINLINRWWGFTHYTKEVIQIVESFMGKVPPRSLYNTLNWGHLDSKIWGMGTTNNTVLKDVDILLIEISSLKVFKSLGAYLQTNRIIELLDGYSDLFDSWPDFSKDKDKFKSIAKYIDDHDVSSVVGDMVVDKVSDLELKSDISYLNSFFKFFGVKKVIFITHFDSCVRGGVIPARVDNNKKIIDICNSLKIPVFDPSIAVRARGVDKMLKGVSSNHYSDYGKEVIANKILEFVRG
jgi:hypothetical protein